MKSSETDTRKSPFRCFEVTVTVWYPKDGRLPDNANEWMEVIDRPGTSLERVVELRYPLSEDIIAKRKELGVRPVYS